MHIHILGICGTFMGGLAVLASELGYTVTGSDQNVYPPMSTQLDKLGIKIFQGYEDLDPLMPRPDYVVVGNVMRRGMPVIEALLNQEHPIPLLSGPEWLARFVLAGKHVLAVSGTHGKTTTASMLAWILEVAGLNPGFLIGGVPNNFGLSARLGAGSYFVVEADEYDSAFFDKRSKFIHYHPRTLIINNIEFDHADIFSDLAAIQQQFHYLIRTVPGKGLVIYPKADQNVVDVLEKGCWTPSGSFSTVPSIDSDWSANSSPSGDQFEVYHQEKKQGSVQWSLLGQHNVQNALAAIAAVENVGVQPSVAIEALSRFGSVKRRLEIKGIEQGVTIYDDFAHHPTAIRSTLAGLRAKLGLEARLVVVLDIRSNTMKAGHHQIALSSSVCDADQIYFCSAPDTLWDVGKMWEQADKPGGVYRDIDALLARLLITTRKADHVIFMSNGGFGGIQTIFLEKLKGALLQGE